MLEERFAEIYTKFKMSLYAKVFKQLDDSYDGLSAVYNQGAERGGQA